MEKLFDTWAFDREMLLVKVLKHPRHKVFAAWMNPEKHSRSGTVRQASPSRIEKSISARAGNGASIW